MTVFSFYCVLICCFFSYETSRIKSSIEIDSLEEDRCRKDMVFCEPWYCCV